MGFPLRATTALSVAITLAACSSLPSDRGYRETAELIKSRTGSAPNWSPGQPDPDVTMALPRGPISVDQAIAFAYLHNPRVREEYARLGLGRAEVEEAGRIANPSFGYSQLKPVDDAGKQITRSMSASFADLLLLPARKRFAAGELQRLQKSVAGQLLNLAAEVEVAWYETVSTDQVASMRDLVAMSAEQSAELAQRFFDAGNINRLQLEQELSAAVQARIAAVRAGAECVRARAKLAGLIGLRSDAEWSIIAQLPQPPSSSLTTDTLLPLALDQRLDLAASRQEVVLLEDALGVTRRWRWLGAVEIGYEHERELDGSAIRGPTLALSLPIFNLGQGAVTRAQAQLLSARAQLDALVLGVHNDAQLGIARLDVAREIAERYRTALLPHREAVVARSQEQVNFMLMGIFELILAKQQVFDAYQEYLEAVRDYWTARAELRRVVGGRLPDDEGDLQPTIGVESMLPSEAPPMDHSKMNMPMDHKMPMDQQMPDKQDISQGAADPHAGHRMTPKPDASKDANETESNGSPPAQHQHGDTP